jgi:hypothetical protein
LGEDGITGQCYAGSRHDHRQEAVAKAIEFAQAMLGATDFLLEEVELGKRGPSDVWLITLSVPGRSGLATLGGREYKTRISKIKRTRQYTLEDFNLLVWFVAQFKIR